MYTHVYIINTIVWTYQFPATDISPPLINLEDDQPSLVICLLKFPFTYSGKIAPKSYSTECLINIFKH